MRYIEILMTQLLETLASAPPAHLKTLVDVLRWRSQHHPTQIIYTFLKDGESETAQLTCAELDRQARAIASVLQAYGAEGERVLIVYPPGLEFIAAFYGCLYAGAIAIPTYPPQSNRGRLSHVQAIAQDAQATIALTTDTILSIIQQQWNETTDLDYLQWLTTAQTLGNPEDWQSPEIRSETLAFLQYTSGSLGTPKGVMVSHENLLYSLSQIQIGFGHTSHSCGVIWLPPYHDMGLIGGILQPLFVGFPVVLMPPAAFVQKPIHWLQAISKYRATTSGGPNFAYDLCVERISTEQKANLDLSQWQVAFNGAEPIRAKTLQRFSDAFSECGFQPDAFYPCYGMAETTLIATGGLPNQSLQLSHVQTSALGQNQVVVLEHPQQSNSTTLVNCGHPLLDQELIIVDPESQRQCSQGQVGELWIAGKNVVQGYWNQPELTQQTFQAYVADTHEGPYLRTGDLGFLHDGELFVTGRLKDMVVIRGCNYYPQDIEATVQVSHPSLMPNRVAVFSVKVDDTEKLVIAQEVKRSALKELDLDETFDEIVDAMLTTVLEHFEFNIYSIVLLRPGHIPKTASGKIQRSACRTQFLEGSWAIARQWWAHPPTVQHNSPEIESLKADVNASPLQPMITEEVIVDYLIVNMARYLEVLPEEISSHKTFARHGLNSITAINLTADLQNWLSIELEPVSFWEYTTIRSLSKYLYKLFEEGQNQVP